MYGQQTYSKNNNNNNAYAQQQQQQQQHPGGGNFQQPVLQHPKPQHLPVQMRESASPSPPPGFAGNSPPHSQQTFHHRGPPQYGPAPTAQPAGAAAPTGMADYARLLPQGANGFGDYNYQAQLGVQFGSAAMAMGSEYVEKNINRYVNVPALKHYFNVNNSYVMRKIALVLFPWRHKSWVRSIVRSELDGRAESYKPPREDINSPDLYIPVMAFVTYILLVGIAVGLKQESEFHPQVLGMTASTALAIVFFEVALLKLGCYLLNIDSDAQLLDLIAYCGYKFVGAIFTRASQLVFPQRWGFWVPFIWASAAIFFFLLRSLRHVIPLDAIATAGVSSSGGMPTTKSVTPMRKRRIHFLFIVAAVQVASMFLLVL